MNSKYLNRFAALAALLAKDTPWEQALILAKALICASLAEAVPLSRSGLHGMFPPETSLRLYQKQISCKKA